MSEMRFYKGKYRVRVMTKSTGGWIVEALEPFDDFVYEKRISVKKGEQRVVAPNLLFRKEALLPPTKEHTYELKMEKKLKRLFEEKEKSGK